MINILNLTRFWGQLSFGTLRGETSKINIVEAITEVNSEGEFVSSNVSVKDTDVLEEAIVSLGDCKSVIFDPISAYLAGTDSHKGANVRQILTPLANVAARTGTAILMVSHLIKSQSNDIQYRFNGSLDFSAICRASCVIGKDPGDDERRLLLPIKVNLAKECRGLAYRIRSNHNEQPVTEWENAPIDFSATEIFGNDSREHNSKLGDACNFLKDLLSEAPMNATDIRKDALANGFSEATIMRAKKQLKIKPKKVEYGRGSRWLWQMPNDH